MRKRIICFLLASVLLFGTCVPVYAEETVQETQSTEPSTEATTTTTAPEAILEEEPDRVAAMIAAMSLKEEIAQMLLVYEPSDAKKLQKQYQYGGYVMFANSFKNSNKKKIKSKIKGWQSVSEIPMFIAVDEEGGGVVRVSKYKQFRKTPFASPQKLYKQGGYKKIKSDTKEKAKLLKSLGINTNFAPVADVPYKKSDYIYSRTFSTSAKSTAKYITTVVETMKDMVGSLKHFPGYGGNRDTHTGMTVDKRSKKTFQTRDLLPFQAGIDEGAPMIMVSHNVVNCFDKKNPASLSKKVHRYLREEMEYDGIIITDGMGMQAITDRYGSPGDAAVAAVLAGNDMLCTPYGVRSVNAIYKAVKSGKIKRSRIDESVRRILQTKLDYGILK